MASKSKDVRIEQLRVFEKKLALRLQQLDQKGISKEKALKDPLVKSFKSKIRETHIRIAAFDKFIQKKEELAQAKAQKLIDLAKKGEQPPSVSAKESSSETKKEESKPKKKAATAVKEASKTAAPDEAAPKKSKKQADAADAEAPKKKASKKKEE